MLFDSLSPDFRDSLRNMADSLVKKQDVEPRIKIEISMDTVPVEDVEESAEGNKE